MGGYGWDATAKDHRGKNGMKLAYGCPAGGSSGSVYGSGPYTDDSSVCTAAMHAGVVAFTGGNVVIEIRAGEQSYTASSAHGVTTLSFGSFDGSFVVVGPTSMNVGGYGWAATAKDHRGKNGEKFPYACPAGGSSGDVYGSGPYTDDSSVCTAAMHAGVVAFTGGDVVIEIRAGQQSYTASSAHGVTTLPFGAFDGSFVVVH
ncbi:MAG: LCCL domain-containing protein [Actinomycetota bacterium]|nr:LCCL domain-containing protein [Actinomycetota bacterium]